MEFSVPDMSCGHCTAAIEKAVKAADPAASVNCDLATHRVSVNTELTGDAVRATIKEAGYETAPVAK